MGIRKCQSILEYVLLLAIVVAAFAAMRTYVSRSIQAHLKVVEEQIGAPEEITDVTRRPTP